MAKVTPNPIMEIAMGFMAAKHLFVASEIGLCIGLAQGPATLDELARDMWHPTANRRYQRRCDGKRRPLEA